MEKCPHPTIVEDEGDRVCKDCGELLDNIDFGAEWKSYGDSSNSRCRYVGSSTPKISLDDIIKKAGLLISSEHRREIEESYKKIVEEKNLRGNTRKAIIAACTLYCMRRHGMEADYTDIRKKFEVDKKQFLEGIAEHNRVFTESRVLGNNVTKTIESVTEKAKTLFGMDISAKRIESYYQNFMKRDREFKHCSPKLGACAIIYYLLCQEKKVVKNDFCKKMDITDSSINKLYKEIPRLLDKK